MKYIITIFAMLICLAATAQPGDYFRTHTHYGTDTTITETEVSSGSDYVHTMEIEFTAQGTYHVTIEGYAHKDTTSYDSEIASYNDTKDIRIESARKFDRIVRIIEAVREVIEQQNP